MVLQPPAIDELGTSSGFPMYLQDRTGQGHAALKSATDQLLALAGSSSVLGSAYQDSLPSGTSVRLEIDRQKAQALGVGFAAISETLSTAMGSLYVNDFPNAGRMQQVIVQADAPARMQIDDVLRLNVRNAAGGMV
ncbi:efflux RND transporter permease subunit, partial [Escherichia coli]